MLAGSGVVTEGGFVKHEQLIADSLTLTNKVLAAVPNISAVIAVPRSGFFAATTLATAAGVPLYQVDQGQITPIGHGLRLNNKQLVHGPRIFIDDSANTGRAMREALKVDPHALTGVVYGTRRSSDVVNFIGVPKELPHFFAWHFFGSAMITNLNFGFDFDGVICRDPYEIEYLCEPCSHYDGFVDEAEPLYLPRPHKVKCIITARLERYRTQTIRWLERHRVNYDTLIMGPWASPKERNRVDLGAWKAQHILEQKLDRFVESNIGQAEKISKMTGKMVICPTTGHVFH